MLRINKLRIAIDCRLQDPLQGIGTAVIALANALSESSTSEQEYTFIVRTDVSDWIRPHISGPCNLQTVSMSRSFASRVKRKLKTVPGVRLIANAIYSPSEQLPAVPVSEGFLESENFDIVHFPTQVAFLTSIPSIYQPWDLQHLHFPEFFSESEIASRNARYRAFCGQAQYVCVQTQWGKKDLIEKYSIEPEKVEVIRWGSVLDAYRPASPISLASAIQKLKLPKQFFFYPAVTWPHKNHKVIIRSLAILKKNEGIKANVCFTGKSTEFRVELDRLANELGVTDQIRYLGFITPEELQAVYAGATAMVFPSKFEGFGLPILEAFQAGVPIVSSNATVLPEVAQEGALYFDPDSPEQLARHLRDLLEDNGMGVRMIEKGKRVLSQYSIKETAASFQDLYERTASRTGKNLRSPLLVR